MVSRRVLTGAAILLVLIVVGIGAIFLTRQSQMPSTASTTQAIRDTLVIDDLLWPTYAVNMLAEVYTYPWPLWGEYSVYQPLAAVDPVKWQQGIYTFVPALANWTISPDGTMYTLTLRQNIKFSNGDPLNSYQVWMQMYAFYYLSGNSTTWWQSMDIFDMSQVNFGPATISLISQSGLINPSAEALAIMSNQSWPIFVNGPSQIVYHLKSAYQWFPGTLISTEGLVFDVQFVLDHGGLGTPAQFNTAFNEMPIPGTGPYIITGVSENNYVSFKQNPNYWGANLTSSEIAQQPIFDPGHAKNVIIRYKPDDLSRYSDLSSGAAQIVPIQSTNWNLVLANPTKYSYLTLPPSSGMLDPLILDTKLYPTNITDVRLAIAHAINYQTINETVYDGRLVPLVGPEYPGWKDFYDLGNFPPYAYNLTLAREYLAKAHITNPTLTFKIVGCEPCLAEAESIQADLAQLNITVTISVITNDQWMAPYGSYATNVAAASQFGNIEQDGSSLVWTPFALTPDNMWDTFVSTTSLWGNFAVYGNPVVQACVDAFTNSDTPHIQAACKQAQAQIYNDAPYLWLGLNTLWFPGGSIVWDTSVVSGFYPDPLWGGGTTAPIFNTVTFTSTGGAAPQQSDISPMTVLASDVSRTDEDIQRLLNA